MTLDECCFERIPFWKDLSDCDWQTLREQVYVKHYDKGQLIYSQHDKCLRMTMVFQGDVRVYMLSEDGREITLFRLHQGDPCVLSASCVINQIAFETSMVAHTACDLLVVLVQLFKSLVERNVQVELFSYQLAVT